MMLKTNLRGQVRQTKLPESKPLLPLFEAVINAFQAIQEAREVRDVGAHRIVIDIEREVGLDFGEKRPPITGFMVTDTGVGLNDANFDSFNTAYSEYKLSRGGKGLGRILWLKAFEGVEITSVFTQPDEKQTYRRAFIFDFDYNPDKALPTPIDTAPSGTMVRLSGFKAPWNGKCPQKPEDIAQHLVEHFLLVFLEPGCPKVEIRDQSVVVSVNDVFETEFKAPAKVHEFQIKGASFTVHGFRLSGSRTVKHRLTYAANHRAVLSENLDRHVPNLRVGRLVDSDGAAFVYLAVVQSLYLTERVNGARTDFDLARDEDDDTDQQNLLREEIRLAEIRQACIAYAHEDLADILTGMNEAKEESIVSYVEDEAPQYKILMRSLGEFVGQIPPNPSKPDIEAALHRQIYEREVRLKQEGSKIIKEADKIADYDDYKRRLTDFMDRYNELGVSALAQYVGHRKIILDLLDKAISADAETGKYPREAAVHDLIFPMRSTSEDVPYHNLNLWLIDERLTYHSFIASDVPFSGMGQLESASDKRPDLFIFDRKLAFAEGEQPISSVVVVEFKRPQRNDYKVGDNPLLQSFEMVEQMRTGTFTDHKRRPVSTTNDRIPAFCYVICDVTPSLRKALVAFDATVMPDNQGYYGFQRHFGAYYEVIDYNKLLRDARRRNRIFFDKLNILGNR